MLKGTPPVIVIVRDSKDYSRVLLYSNIPLLPFWNVQPALGVVNVNTYSYSKSQSESSGPKFLQKSHWFGKADMECLEFFCAYCSLLRYYLCSRGSREWIFIVRPIYLPRTLTEFHHHSDLRAHRSP